jgi:hypothetical protein
LTFDFIKKIVLTMFLLFVGVVYLSPTFSYAISLDDEEAIGENCVQLLLEDEQIDKEQFFYGIMVSGDDGSSVSLGVPMESLELRQ